MSGKKKSKLTFITFKTTKKIPQEVKKNNKYLWMKLEKNKLKKRRKKPSLGEPYKPGLISQTCIPLNHRPELN